MAFAPWIAHVTTAKATVYTRTDKSTPMTESATLMVTIEILHRKTNPHREEDLDPLIPVREPAATQRREQIRRAGNRDLPVLVFRAVEPCAFRLGRLAVPVVCGYNTVPPVALGSRLATLNA